MDERTKEFLQTLSDVVETNHYHSLSFELRKLNQRERSDLVKELRSLSEK